MEKTYIKIDASTVEEQDEPREVIDSRRFTKAQIDERITSLEAEIVLWKARKIETEKLI